MRNESAPRIALATAEALAVLYVLCSVFYALFPAFGMAVMSALFHMPMQLSNFSLGNFFLGLISIVIAGYISGYVFGFALGYRRSQPS